MELNAESVLEAVARLHAESGERILTLLDIAQALPHSGGKRVTARPGARVTGADGNLLPELMPPWPAWVTALNNILRKLGEEGRLPVTLTATVVFPAE